MAIYTAEQIQAIRNKMANCSHPEWRIMDWQEAYPASSGRACKRCGKCDLGWLGRNVNLKAE